MPSINRRNFLKSATLGIAASVNLPILAENYVDNLTLQKDQSILGLHFNKEKKFKVLQIADTHYVGTHAGYPKENWRPSVATEAYAQTARQNLRNMLKVEKPDLVIHTGDIIYGQPAKDNIREILSPMAELNVPFVVTLGNHDSEFGLSRQEVFDFIRTLPCNINKPSPEDVHNASNNAIVLHSTSGNIERIFYLFDTGRHYIDSPQCYDFLRLSQLNWYSRISDQYRKLNGGKPVAALAFMHMPIREMNDALRDTKRIIRGNLGEEPGSSWYNSGLFALAEEKGDIEAYVFGHEHDSDCAIYFRHKYMIYGRYSGYDSVYNDLKPGGVRVFEFTEGQRGFRSWIRLFDNIVNQNLTYPDSFKTELPY